MGARKVKITDATIKGLKPDPKGQGGQEIADLVVPGLRIRPNKEYHSYVFYGRFDGKPTRRTIAPVGKIGLAEAREKAREWLKLAGEGRDPKAEERAARLAAEGRITFGAAMEKFISRHVAKTRKAKDVEREIRKELMPRFEDVALADITRRDIAKMVGEIRDRGATYQAHHILGHAKTFFNWAIAQEEFGIEVSPCDRMQPKKLIGPKQHRIRVLDDDELRAAWRATERLSYPWGPFYRMLMLTGARKTEVSDARWPEFDLDEKKLWTIPSQRFKSGSTHLVPLSGDAVALLTELPRWEEGDFVFSTRGGSIPIDGFSKSKRQLDMLMSEELRHDVEPFVTHDVRRTVRTRLSALVPSEIAERVIGHTLRGLHKVYDQHAYLDEKRQALELWAAKLRSIVTPPPDNLVDIEEQRRARA